MQKKIKSNTDSFLKVSLHGMDDKMKKMMTAYLKITCNGIAVVVNENEAEAEIVDIDNHLFENILRKRLSQRPRKPIIALSLYEVTAKKVIFVKKPVDVSKMSVALLSVKKTLNNNLRAQQKKTIILLPDHSYNTPSKTNKQTPPLIPLKANELENETLTIPSFIPSIEDSLPSVEKETTLETHHGKDLVVYEKNKKNLRKSIRYTFKAFSGDLKSHSIFGFQNHLAIKILNISSNSALIQSATPLKVRSKATIDIRLDLLNSFSVPVRISRKTNNSTYGLIFLKYQHELCDYLINSGRKFHID